jgi:hypothetical protein
VRGPKWGVEHVEELAPEAKLHPLGQMKLALEGEVRLRRSEGSSTLRLKSPCCSVVAAVNAALLRILPPGQAKFHLMVALDHRQIVDEIETTSFF